MGNSHVRGGELSFNIANSDACHNNNANSIIMAILMLIRNAMFMAILYL